MAKSNRRKIKPEPPWYWYYDVDACWWCKQDFRTCGGCKKVKEYITNHQNTKRKINRRQKIEFDF